MLDDRHIRIHPSFTKLEVALRTAVTNELGKLDKNETSENDVLDALRLSLLNVRTRKQSERHYVNRNPAASRGKGDNGRQVLTARTSRRIY